MSWLRYAAERRTRGIDLFAYIAGLLLLIVAAGKLHMILGEAKILRSADPIFQVEVRYLYCIAAAFELTTALFCFVWRGSSFTVGVIAWFATIVLVYRFGFWWVGDQKPCSCLGSWTSGLGISTESADVIAKSVLAYLLIGSYGSMFVLRRGSNSV